MTDVTGTTQAFDNLADESLKTQHNSRICFVGSCLVVLGIILATGQGY